MRMTRLALLVAVAFPLSSACGAADSEGASAGGSQAFGGTSGNGATGATGGNGTGGTAAGTGTGGTGGSIVLPDGGGTGGIEDGDVCAAEDHVGSLVPANVLFVIDRSGSMNCLPGEPESSCNLQPKPNSKWSQTLPVLQQSVDTLAASANVNAGLVMFPVAGTNCGVTDSPNVLVNPLTSSQAMAMKAFLGTVNPGGNTPIAGATILGYDYLHTVLQASGNKFLVLLTDGAETCARPDNAPDVLPKLLDEDVPNAQLVGIRTFTIGVPGAEMGRALLSEMAWRGGTARSAGCSHDPALAVPDAGDCHFDMTTSTNLAADLAQALADISGTVLTCEFDVPTPTAGSSFDPDKVNVEVNGVTVPPDPGAPCGGGAEGWQYQDATHQKIVLCGGPCASAQAPNSSVKIVLGCPTVPPA